MNKIILAGNLIKDAELNFIGDGVAKASFCMAVERSYQKDKNNKKSDFINCELLGKRAEGLAQYLTKGKPIIVEGELNIDNYEKDGEKKSYTKVKVDRVEFQRGAKSEGGNDNKGSFSPVVNMDEEDVPF